MKARGAGGEQRLRQCGNPSQGCTTGTLHMGERCSASVLSYAAGAGPAPAPRSWEPGRAQVGAEGRGFPSHALYRTAFTPPQALCTVAWDRGTPWNVPGDPRLRRTLSTATYDGNTRFLLAVILRLGMGPRQMT